MSIISERLAALAQWNPPADWMKITTLDLHTGGEPLRVVIAGLPRIEGKTVLEKRRYFREHYDDLRTGLMWEPRGHADMYGAIVTPSLDGDFDVFFIHNEGYSTMCGHAILALTKMAFETGLVDASNGRKDLVINVPAGKIHSVAHFENGLVQSASFKNVPSFLYSRGQTVEVPGLGKVRYDIAYGGAFYAVVEAAPLSLKLDAEDFGKAVDYGRRIKHAVMANTSIKHPFEDDLSFLYGTIFTGPAFEQGHHSRNICVFADGEIDRSATGSGVSARAALHHAKGELKLGQAATIESIVGSTMTVRAIEATTFGPHPAIIPEVTGSASFTGRHEFFFDPKDGFRKGFIFR